MGVDERLRRELGQLAPADPSGAYERVVEKRVRRGVARRAQVVALTVIVLAGSALGIYGLLQVFGVGDRTTPAVPSEGGILFVDLVDGRTDLFVVRPDGTGLRNLTHDAASEMDGAWSPDGSRIAFVRGGPATAATDIYVMNADGTDLEQVTESGGVSSGPAWSPDGSRIAYTDEGLWVIPVEGGDAQLLVEGGVSDPTWSPDGEGIAYGFSEVGNPGDELSGLPDLWTVPVEGGDPTRLTNTGQAFEPDWSLDGERIVFTSGRDIAVLDLDTGAVRVLTRSEDPRRDPYDRGPDWSPDGSQIVFSSDRARDGSMHLYRMYADGSDPTLVLDRTFAFRFLFLDPDWAGDVPPISTEPSGPTPIDTPTELAGVGPVCRLTSVEGDLQGNGSTGMAHVFTKPDEAGGCGPEGTGVHLLGIDLGTGTVRATTPLECGLGECSAFAAPDVDGDGRAEIAVRVPSSGVPWDFVSLYRVAPAADPSADEVPVLERVAVEEPAAPHAGVVPGPLLIPWGSSESEIYGAECWSTTDHADPDIPVLVLFHGTPDDAGGWDQRYVELTIDGSTARVFDVFRGSGEGTDLITRYDDAFCGSPIQP